ncbi:MAG: CpaF family protein [Acidobacteria bacterium]|nr:CpaF family protein [Acidobacteriota bacterium]
MNLKQMDYETMVNPDKRLELYRATEFVISRILDKDAAWITSRDDRVQLVREILNEALGLGPIEYLLADDSVSEIMVNGARRVFVERKGQIELTPFYFTDEPQLRRVIERIVVRVGRRIDEKSPMVDARLPDGSRVNAIIPPLAIGGSALTIRKFSKFPLTSETLLKLGSLNLQMSKFLQACVVARKNTIISGGSGSGKTTLLNILSGTIPPNERIITIEDSAELQLPQVNVVRLETRPANVEGEGTVSIRDLVRNALRMRPDRIVVGECRGAESMDMLQAMNTGHDGSLTTVHANSPGDALSRLETMCLMAGLDLPARAIRKQIASAVQIIVQQTRLSDGSRKITQVTEVCGMEGEVTTMQDIFRFRQDRVLRDGPVEGQFEATGNIPTFLDLLRPKGIELPREVFLRQR